MRNYFAAAIMSTMDTITAIKKAGSVKQLALLLDVTHQAVYAWGPRLPKMRLWQLRVLRPGWFRVVRK